jgi:hypothetical protein
MDFFKEYTQKHHIFYQLIKTKIQDPDLMVLDRSARGAGQTWWSKLIKNRTNGLLAPTCNSVCRGWYLYNYGGPGDTTPTLYSCDAHVLNDSYVNYQCSCLA